MATVVEVKLGFVVLLAVAAAFLVAGAAGEEWCHYVVDMEIVRGREGRVKFEVSNSGVSGASWTQEKQVRADDSNIRASPCVNGYYQFVTKNSCANPCHLTLKVVGQIGVLPASVRIRGYPSSSQELNPAAPKYDHLFTRRILDLLEADMDDC